MPKVSHPEHVSPQPAGHNLRTAETPASDALTQIEKKLLKSFREIKRDKQGFLVGMVANLALDPLFRAPEGTGRLSLAAVDGVRVPVRRSKKQRRPDALA